MFGSNIPPYVCGRSHLLIVIVSKCGYEYFEQTRLATEHNTQIIFNSTQINEPGLVNNRSVGLLKS